MNKHDRRYLRTEKQLQSALCGLIIEADYPTITVEQIAVRADVARKTFYAHYTNKDELLWATMEALFDAIVADMANLDPETLLLNGKPLSYPIFQHVYTYARFYRTMLSEDGTARVILRVLSYIAEVSYSKHAPLRKIAPQLTVPPRLIAQMLSGSALGALLWWLETGMVQSPEAMSYLFSQIMAPGILAAMGLEAF